MTNQEDTYREAFEAAFKKPKLKFQFCDSRTNVNMWIPAGAICKKCKKALDTIRKHKLGFGWMPKAWLLK